MLTSVGGLVAPNMIKSLRDFTFVKYHIVGVDMNKNAVGFFFTDKKYIVPPPTTTKYIDIIWEICQKEKIEIIIPLSDEETIALSKHKDEFRSEGIVVACSDHNSVLTSSDKGKLLSFLRERKIDIPLFKIPKSVNELEQFVYDLGYPNEPVVFKPRKSRGARGFWLISNKVNKIDFLLKSRERQDISLDWLLDAFQEVRVFPEVLLMEYLPGKDFNVDVLLLKSYPIYIIPNQRLTPKAGPVQNGLIKKDIKIEKMVKTVVDQFNFDFWVNIELAYSKPPHSRPLVYEINPRISAPIVANKAAGVDLLNYGIQLALGKHIPRNLDFTETRMMRYWNDFFMAV